MRDPINPIQSWLLGELPLRISQDALASSRWLLTDAPSSRKGFVQTSSRINTTRSSPTLVSPVGDSCVNSPSKDSARNANVLTSHARQRISKLEVKLAQRDRMIVTLQSTVRNLTAYIRQLEQLNEVPENGSLGGTADRGRPVVDGLPTQHVTEFTPRLRLNQIRDLSKQSIPTPVTVSSPVASSDDIDEVVQRFLESRDMLGALRRVSYGVYTVGDGPRRISICIKNNKPLVRSGGGSYLHLDMYLSNH